MKLKISCRPRIKNSVAQKLISNSLAIGLLLNNITPSLASTLSEDGRYETFEGNNITIDNVLEEDKVDIEIEGNTMVNYAQNGDKELILNGEIDLEGDYVTTTEGVGGGLVDVEIEGNTLVNVLKCNGDWFDKETILETDSSTHVALKYYPLNNYDLSLFKSNTEYTVIPYVDYTVVEDGDFYIHLNTEINGVQNELFRVYKERFNKPTIIRTSNITDRNVKSLFIGGSNCSVKIKSLKVLVLEGNWLNKEIPEYFEGMKSVGQDDTNGYKIEITSSNSDGTKFNTKEILLNEPLRGLPNGVKDRIIKKDGKWYIERNLKEVELDGSNGEVWATYNSNDSTICYVKYMDDKAIGYTSIISNNFKTDHTTWKPEMVQESISGNGDDRRIFLRLNTSRITSTFENYLSENPVTVVYQLETPIYEPLEVEPTLNTYSDITHISNNSTIPANMKVKNSGYDVILKPNTEYTIAVDIDTSVQVNTLLGVNLSGTISETNNNILTLVTPEIIVDNSLRLYGKGIKVSNVRVLEGDKSKNIPEYFRGIKSSFENNAQEGAYYNLELISTNKNLINWKNDQFETIGDYGTINKDDYGIIYSAKDVSYGIKISNRIRLKPNTDYILSSKWDIIEGTTVFSEPYTRVYLPYSRQYINSNGDGTVKFTTDKTGLVRPMFYIDFPHTGDITVRFKDISLYEYTSNNEYTPYQYNSIEIPLSEPLRGLPNGVKDKIIKRNGQWVVERNCGEVILNGSEEWVTPSDLGLTTQYWLYRGIDNIKKYSLLISDVFINDKKYREDREIIFRGDSALTLNISKSKLTSNTIESFKEWLSKNPVKVVYQLENPIYEPLNISPTLDTYLDTTHISNNSNIPANMKVTVDRTINRATEAIELMKINPTVANIERARMWTNLLKESAKKDDLHNQINEITDIEDLEIEKKTVSANMDLYIKSQNSLSMSLSTNSIIFDEFSGVEDMEKLNAVDITVDSSLPYQLNSYLESEIKSNDGLKTIPKELLNIRLNGEEEYKAFNDINEKLILKENCEKGNDNVFGVDLILKGSRMSDADIYKTIIKFEAEQK